MVHLQKSYREAAEVLSQQFFRISTKVNTTNIPQIMPKNLVTEALAIFEANEQLLKIYLLQLKKDKSPGIDVIHPIILKEMAEQLCVPLNIIFNSIINTSMLPRQWKDAIICPIYKKSDKRNPANYKPVFLTSIICKTLERLIVDQLIEHIKVNHPKWEQPHGFTAQAQTYW